MGRAQKVFLTLSKACGEAREEREDYKQT